MAAIVVDANIFGIAKEDGHRSQVDAVHLLCCFRQGHKLAVDADGQLTKQYRRCLGNCTARKYPPPVVNTLFHKHLYTKDRVIFVPAKLSPKQRLLLKSANYPHKDYLLVAIALGTNDRLNVSEDGGLHSSDIVDILLNKFCIRMSRIQAGLKLLGRGSS